jgi:hypothetical protein
VVVAVEQAKQHRALHLLVAVEMVEELEPSLKTHRLTRVAEAAAEQDRLARPAERVATVGLAS